MNSFLITTRQEMTERGIDALDFIMISGDAYVDHVSFGAALICRLLEKKGYSAGIIAQPEWKNAESFGALGKPRLAFLVTSGNIDSMVNHYTAAKKRRNGDVYSPGGAAGKRPDRAVIVYCKKIRELYRDAFIITGGIEASLRRLAHYDYWSNAVRRSIIMDADCDLLVYGMGERQISEIAERLKNSGRLDDIPGTAYRTRDLPGPEEFIRLPDYNSITSDKKKYAESFKLQYDNADPITGKRLVEPYGNVFVVQNPPAAPLTRPELDSVYGMRFVSRPHDSYAEGVPAIDEVKFSLVSSRGCFGACNFCALTFHQGRIVSSRSLRSLAEETRRMTLDPDFKGYIHDVGGPTANFRATACEKQPLLGACRRRRCLFPEPCEKLIADHSDYLRLLDELRQIPGVKKVFIRSGIRFDYALADKKTDFIEKLAQNHVSGQLKTAPEHVSARVLKLMGKPGNDVYEAFVKRFYEASRRAGKEQYIVPYLMSSHPGSSLASAVELAEYLRDNKLRPEQVQDFYPTPATVSTCMYHAGVNPLTGETVYVPRSAREKAMQRALIQYRLPQNRELVMEALKKAGREDLIGFGPKCLIRPDKAYGKKPRSRRALAAPKK